MDRLYAFLQPYLTDPYSKLRPQDVGFEGPVVVTLDDYSIQHVYLGALTWRDPGEQGRADLIVPVRLLANSGGAPQFFDMVIVNTPDLHAVPAPKGATALQHWNPKPELVQRPDEPVTSATQFPTLIADLNGDGLADRANFDIPSEEQAALGTVAILKGVSINVGPKLVPEHSVPDAILDTRLGYIASHAQALLRGVGSSGNMSSMAASDSVVKNDVLRRQVYTSAGALRMHGASRSFFAPTKDDAKRAVSVVSTLSPEGSDSGPVAAALPNEILAGAPELNFDILAIGTDTQVSKQTYMPDTSLYTAGLVQGQNEGQNLIGTFQRARDSYQNYLAAIKPLRNLPSTNSPQPILKAFADSFTATAISTLDGLQMREICGDYLDAWRAVVNAPIFLPRRVTAALDTIPYQNPAGAHPLTSPDIQAYLHSLDSTWLIETGTDGQYLLNGGRIVGMCLAFLNLMNLRSSAAYISDLQANSPAKYVTNAVQTVSSMSARLSLIAKRDPNTVDGSDFIMASITSGYSDLIDYISIDYASIARLQGYQTGQRDALKTLQSILGQQIPGLHAAQDVLAAANLIGQYVTDQQTEINSLKSLVDSLQQTVQSLNTLLQTANTFIQQLEASNQSLKNDLDEAHNLIVQLEGTAQAFQGFANAGATFFHAGTGFMVAGPLGAFACALFC